MRIDIFKKGNKFFIVPLYVVDSVHKVIPNKAVVAEKPDSEWIFMDETYTFLFSVQKNDWISVRDKKSVREGYYCDFDRHTCAISLWIHDRNLNVGKNGKFRGIGIKNAIYLEKYHVDLLGKLHKVKQETRQPLRVGQCVDFLVRERL